MKPIEFQQRDGMPVEVATAMLLEPRARLTNTFRKQCRRARERVIVSTSPIQRIPAQNAAGEIVKGWGYAEPAERTIESKTVLRFRRSTLEQLGRWRRRAISRRATVQRAYLKVPNSARFDSARQALSLMAERLDIIRDCADDEIAARQRQVQSVVVLRRGFKSSVDFYPHPGPLA